MTTEQMKELYAAGEWRCVVSLTGKHNWMTATAPRWNKFEYYKLIHKKHADVLDHVLNGGEVIYISTHDLKDLQYLNEFIENYHKDNEYEIIKDKPSLNSLKKEAKELYETIERNKPNNPPIIGLKNHNLHLYEEILKSDNTEMVEEAVELMRYETRELKLSLNNHYCLATQAHYEKLVEDGYEKSFFLRDGEEFDDKGFKFLLIYENSILQRNFAVDFIPMHLHNNEWVFGSLEQEVMCNKCGDKLKGHEDDSSTTCRWCVQGWVEEPKPVERITREEAFELVEKSASFGQNKVTFGKDIVRALFPYIEYLKKENDIIKALYVNEKGGSYAELSDRLGYDVSDRE